MFMLSKDSKGWVKDTSQHIPGSNYNLEYAESGSKTPDDPHYKGVETQANMYIGYLCRSNQDSIAFPDLAKY